MAHVVIRYVTELQAKVVYCRCLFLANPSFAKFITFIVSIYAFKQKKLPDAVCMGCVFSPL